MKLLIFWDIYGRIWRKWLKKELPGLLKKYNPDFVIANVDNITSWRGAIEKHILEMNKIWVDIMTGWDHIVDNYSKIKDYLDNDNSNLLRFANFYEWNISWKWHKIFEKNGKRLLVIHMQWEVFMNHKVTNPFLKIDEVLSCYDSWDYDWVILDFHKEATAEWYWLANYVDWRVSFMFGTHTHVQTNDDIIMDGWLGYINDLGMNWPLKSVIWADFMSVKPRFLSWISKWKIEQSLDENYIVSGVFVEIWSNKKTTNIEKIKIKWI